VSESENRADQRGISQSAPPYVDCIQWVPRRFSGGTAPTTIVDLVFTQQVLGEIHAQLASAPASPVFGAIVGTVFEDPTCARRWARLDRVVASRSPVAEDAAVDDLVEAVSRTRTSVGDASIIGWYRTHHQAGLYLAPDEATFHEREFPEPWAFALILAGASDRLAGGVFQRTDPEGLSRSVYTPFYELAAEDPRPGSTARRTLLTWANYQSETRVVRPGETEAPVTVATIRDLAEPPVPSIARDRDQTAPDILDEVESTPLPPERMSPAIDGLPLLELPPDRGRETPETAEPASTDEVDAEWEKVQIQRSLMAVGRSLGPGTISELGAPAHERPEARSDAPAPAPAADDGVASDVDPEDTRPSLTVIDTREAAPTGGEGKRTEETGGVIPISSGVSAAKPLVGGARRRSRLPAMKMVAAAAGVVVLAGAGWVGTRMVGAPADGAESNGESAVAGLSLSPNDLFGQPGEPVDSGTETVEPASDEPVIEGRGEGVSNEEDVSTSTSDGATPPEEAAGDAIGALDPRNVLADGEAESPTAGADANDSAPIPSPLPPDIVAAPTLDSFQVQDPAVSAFDNALTIFRVEVDRYEELRKEFDEELTTCNPLNLAYRGVLEGSQRLERRHADIADRVEATTARTYRAALRQFAVARTHYELTDCPMPIGG